MGRVLAFRQFDDRSTRDVAGLCATLTGSVDFMWRGGWAEVGEHGEIAVYRRQHCLGFWLPNLEGFSFYPIEGGERRQRVTTVEEAYQVSLCLLGDPPPEPAP
jgi:hypothetical protein